MKKHTKTFLITVQVSRRDNTSVFPALNPSKERLKFRKYQRVINTKDKSSEAGWEQWRRLYHVSCEWDSLKLLMSVILILYEIARNSSRNHINYFQILNYPETVTYLNANNENLMMVTLFPTAPALQRAVNEILSKSITVNGKPTDVCNGSNANTQTEIDKSINYLNECEQCSWCPMFRNVHVINYPEFEQKQFLIKIWVLTMNVLC